MTSRRVVWFSAGAPSAVLAKLERDAVLAYCDTRSEHPYHPSRRELLEELLASNWQP